MPNNERKFSTNFPWLERDVYTWAKKLKTQIVGILYLIYRYKYYLFNGPAEHDKYNIKTIKI